VSSVQGTRERWIRTPRSRGHPTTLASFTSYSGYRSIMSFVSGDDEAWPKVTELARERPEWLPIVRAACKVAEESEPYGGRFAGRWVLQEAGRWEPGLRLLVSYRLLEKAGESTRGGRRAYYRMPDWRGVRHALERLEQLGLGHASADPGRTQPPARG
jgi:hypothetical protein